MVAMMLLTGGSSYSWSRGLANHQSSCHKVLVQRSLPRRQRLFSSHCVVDDSSTATERLATMPEVQNEQEPQTRNIKLNLLDEGSTYPGTVARIRPFGLFVDLDDFDVTGLVPMKEIADYEGFITVTNLRMLVTPGDRVQVKVLSIDRSRDRLSLSILQGDPQLAAQYVEKLRGMEEQDKQREKYQMEEKFRLEEVALGQKHEGIVTLVVDFGIFVSIGAERDVLVHKSQLQLSNDGKASDIYKQGDKVAVAVTGVEAGRNGRLRAQGSLYVQEDTSSE